MIIYKIANSVNDRLYIGLTSQSLTARFSKHLSDYKRKNYRSKLYNAFRKHGVEKFSIHAIDYATTIEELSEKEKEWIKKLDTVQNGYNILSGGLHTISDSCSDYWKNLTLIEKEDYRRKMSRSKQGVSSYGRQSQFIGVSPTKNKWSCQATIQGKKISKLYETETAAAEAYDKLVMRAYPSSAKTNFNKAYSSEELESFYLDFLKPKVYQRTHAKKYKGVVYDKFRDKWIGRLYERGRLIWTAYRKTEEEAYQAQQAKLQSLDNVSPPFHDHLLNAGCQPAEPDPCPPIPPTSRPEWAGACRGIWR